MSAEKVVPLDETLSRLAGVIRRRFVLDPDGGDRTVWHVDRPIGLELACDLIPTAAELRGSWCNEPCRMVWVDSREGAIITYCEGDFRIEQALNRESFARMLDAAAEFYAAGWA